MSYDAEWTTATNKENLISALLNGEMVKTSHQLDNVSLTPAEITAGRTHMVYIGGSYPNNKVSMNTINQIKLIEYRYYYLVKGKSIDTIYCFQSPDTI